MPVQVANNVRMRRDFGRIEKIIDLPYLIEIQKNSYDLFLQRDVPEDQRKDIGLQAVFKSVFPIEDFNATASLEYVSYSLGEPKYDVDECHERGMNFAAPLKVTVQLVLWDVDAKTGSRSIRNVKEQEVYFGEVPLMTRNGTFMINGTERVIVSQLHRSPGVFFEHDKGKTHASGKFLYSARVIPYRGSWLDFEFDPKDILFVRIDRRRKFHLTVLLRALGMQTEELLNYFYKTDTVLSDGELPLLEVKPEQLRGLRATRDVRDPRTNDLIVREGRRFTRAVLRQMDQAGVRQIPISWEEVVGRVAAHDVVDPESDQVIVECNETVTEEKLEHIRGSRAPKLNLFFLDDPDTGPYLRDTLLQDKMKSCDEALLEIYRRLRPGEPPTRGDRGSLFQQPVLQSGPLRPVAGRKAQARPSAQAQHGVLPGTRGQERGRTRGEAPEPPGRAQDPAQGRHPRGGSLPHRPEERQRLRGRHRPPGQPPRAAGGRAGGEPFPRGAGAHGAGHQGEDGAAGHRHPHAAGTHQPQAGIRRPEGVLRLEPVVPVPGPDQPPVRGHPQAEVVRAGSRRPDAGAGGLRGP